MSEIVRLKTQPEIDHEAAVWTWRLDSETLTDDDRSQLETWLRQDPRHRRALEELGRCFSVLDRLSEAPQEDLAAFAPERPWRALPGARAWWAAAATLLLAFGAALWLELRSGITTWSTAIGQERQVSLADGSLITLNTNTLLEVRLTARRRDVYLERGEAHFEVDHDAARPFFVHAANTVIRDVGTQFEVRLRADHDVEVLVNEGRVEVQEGSVGGDAHELSAGEQMSIAGPHLKVMAVSPARIADELAWRNGALIFESEPLAQAVREVGRYTRSRIVLTSPQIASLRISGRFRTDDVPGFFEALQAALPVRVSRPGGGVIDVGPR
jgi:transmembrane sensor